MRVMTALKKPTAESLAHGGALAARPGERTLWPPARPAGRLARCGVAEGVHRRAYRPG